jgi:hypothetical protein
VVLVVVKAGKKAAVGKSQHVATRRVVISHVLD